MSSGGKSGQGTTIQFGTTNFVANWRTINGLEELRERLDDSHLGLAEGAHMTSVPADLIGSNEFTGIYEFDQSADVQPPIDQPPETITITYQKKTGEATAATLAGTGYIIRRKGPDIEVNATDIMQGEVDIVFDGKTGPTYTAGTPTP